MKGTDAMTLKVTITAMLFLATGFSLLGASASIDSHRVLSRQDCTKIVGAANWCWQCALGPGCGDPMNPCYTIQGQLENLFRCEHFICSDTCAADGSECCDGVADVSASPDGCGSRMTCDLVCDECTVDEGWPCNGTCSRCTEYTGYNPLCWFY